LARRPWLRRCLVAFLVAGAVTSGGYAYAAATRDDPAPPKALGPGDVTIRIGIEHSRFDVDEVHVVAGTRLRFVVDNRDPIAHELITGPPAVHRLHEKGTHPKHPPVPGEVSVGSGDLAMTTYRFDQPGHFEFACHLPGHYAYGMHGIVVVEPAQG
jgi:uncharacterized cupredoxin-like copper-binding protein